jgi:predicted PurR-regulated permease PerM
VVLIFVLVPAWSKSTYNVFVVISLLLTMMGLSTLATAVVSFKIADEISDIVSVMNQIVDSSQVFQDLQLNVYVNQSSHKIIEMMHKQFNLPPEMTAKTLQQIMDNEHVNWTHVFDLENIFSFTTDSNNKESGI